MKLLAALSLAASPAFAAGLSGVVHAEAARGLPKAAQEALASSGFAVVAGRERQFFSLYDDNAYRKIPSLVTTDVVLHVFHVRFDEALAELEVREAAPALKEFAASQVAAALALFPKSGAPEPRLLRLALYHAVPLALLDPQAAVDPRLADAVREEVEALQGPLGKTAGRACGAPLAGSLFTPRGHYDRWSLKGYFRALTFYAQCAVPLDTPESTGFALDVLRLASGPSQASLARVEALQRFVAGPPDAPGLLALSAAAGELPPLPAPAPAAARERVMKALRDSAGRVASLDRAPSFRLLDGSATPDNLLFGKTAGGVDRPLPSALDLLAALGSERARALLAPQLDRLPSLRAALASPLPPGAGVFGRWLDVLRLVVSAPPAGQPPFILSPAWADRPLVTAAGSWAELRHDTLLYVKQPLVMMQGGDHSQLPVAAGGYVEPRPDVYRALQELSGELAAIGGRSEGLDELLRFFIEVAELELVQKPLPKASEERLRRIGTELEALTRGRADRLPDQALVADVFTSLTPDGRERVLHAAIGDVDELWAVVPRGKARVLMRGGVFSYYELVEPTRYDDAAWNERLRRAPPPERPGWARVEAGGARRKD